MKDMKYRCVKQYDSTDCAGACLASIAWYYGKKMSMIELSEALETNKEGTSVWDICRVAENIGFLASAYKKNEEFRENELEFPCVAHVCTFRINGAPFPRQRCKRLAPTVRYPFVVTC